MSSPAPIEYERVDPAAGGARLGRRLEQTFKTLLYLLGPVVALVAMRLAGGYGWSPLAFFLLGAVGTPLIRAALVRWRPDRPWTMRWVAMGFGGAGLMPNRIVEISASLTLFESPDWPPAAAFLAPQSRRISMSVGRDQKRHRDEW